MRISGAVLALAVVAGVAVVVAPVAFGQAVTRPSQGQVIVRTEPPQVVVQTPGTQSREAVRVFAGGAELGVTVRDLDPKDKTEGVAVAAVAPGGAAEKAGIKEGDVVVEFDGEHVRSIAQFERLVRETVPGRNVKVAVVRAGKRTDLTVTPEAGGATSFAFDTGALERQLAPLRNLRPLNEQQIRDFEQRMRELADRLQQQSGNLRQMDERRMRELEQRLRDMQDRLQRQFQYDGRTYEYRVPPAPNPPNPPSPPSAPNAPRPPRAPVPPSVRVRPLVSPRAQLGITVQELTPQLRDYFGAKEGVLVSSVTDQGAADKAGLKAGDIVTSIDGNPVASQSDLTRALAGGSGPHEISLGVVRDKKAMTIKVQVGR
jgi:membrane-associated protease RseP (regulator of RpoE activity)